MQLYRVRNWQRFQHYKDRNPPWIKLHFEIMTSADWVMLADASKLLAVVCMLIASRNEGMVPGDPHYLKRVAYLDKLPDLTPLIDCGFLEKLQASDSKAERKQANARPETEAYREETEKKESKPPLPPSPAPQPQPAPSPPERVGNVKTVAEITGNRPAYHAVEFHPRYDEVREKIVARLPALGRQNASEVNRWLLDGADPDLDIIPTVNCEIDRMRGNIGSFKFFTRAIESSVAVRRERDEQHQRLSKKYEQQDEAKGREHAEPE